jgi:serine/threonine protein kinase
MTCPKCGTANAADSAFCVNCGAGLGAPQSVATAEAPSGPTHAVLEPGGDELLEKVRQHLGGDYAIEKELGRGGMAVVYKGVERALERSVAIKVVPPESANAGQAAERFRREARLAASLDHPNIIPVYRVGQAGPLHFMAMKFVEGRAVDAVIESQGALPISVAIAVLRYSAHGLAFAHDKKIVHRDIKGANILVDKDGRVMVSDFGIARALEEVSLTASGMVIGTPYYMSPEQCGGQKISPQSDQYSLGILGFQMLTGEVPFNADSMVGVIQHHYMTPVPDIRAVRSDVPQELLDIIYCSLNKAPEDRFTTTKEMALALDNVPQTDTEREEAERLLRELSAGRVIPRVRTGTLPPLHLTISGPAAPVVPRPVAQPRKALSTTGQTARRRRKKKKNKMMAPALAAFVIFMGGGGYMMYSQQQEQARLAAEQARAAAEAAEARKGVIVLAGVPSEVRVTIDNRSYKNGDTVRLAPGKYDGRAEGPNVRTSFPQFEVDSGSFAVRDLSNEIIAIDAGTTASPTTTVVQGPAIQSGARSAASRPAAVADSGELRLTVSPNYVDIWVDGTKVGSGRKFLQASVGGHDVRFYAPNCTEKRMRLNVEKDKPTIQIETMDCR